MKVAYACVVDAHPAYEKQALLWTLSILRHVRGPAADIKVHCLPGVSTALRQHLHALQVDILDIERFPGDQPYCNKIQQCFSRVFDAYDRAIFCDTDTFHLNPITIPADTLFAAKTVDLANPPLQILHALYHGAGIAPSPTVPTGCPLSPQDVTVRSNFNGGLYALAPALLADLGPRWRDHARWLLARLAVHAPARFHVDQMAMALALDDLGIATSLLPARANFPVHLPAERLRTLPHTAIDVLHYHRHVTPGGTIMPTGLAHIDHAIAHANESIAACIGSRADNMPF